MPDIVGHNTPPDYKFKVYTSKQKRGATPQIQRKMRRRAAVEPGTSKTSTEWAGTISPPSRRYQ
jgi:hypothetical protein